MLPVEEWSMDKVNKGELTPMFFGSAMTNFGVHRILEEFLRLAPAPQPRMSSDGLISPDDEKLLALFSKLRPI